MPALPPRTAAPALARHAAVPFAAFDDEVTP